jgi:hypothetical protein
MKIEIRVDQNRLGELVTVDEFIALQDGEIRAIRDVLGRFVVGEDGEYLDTEEGVRAIGGLTINQLKETAEGFTRKAQGAAVPPASGAA